MWELSVICRKVVFGFFFQVGKLWNVGWYSLASEFEWETSRSFSLIQNFSSRVPGILVSVRFSEGLCGQACLGNASLHSLIQTSFRQACSAL